MKHSCCPLRWVDHERLLRSPVWYERYDVDGASDSIFFKRDDVIFTLPMHLCEALNRDTFTVPVLSRYGLVYVNHESLKLYAGL